MDSNAWLTQINKNLKVDTTSRSGIDRKRQTFFKTGIPGGTGNLYKMFNQSSCINRPIISLFLKSNLANAR